MNNFSYSIHWRRLVKSIVWANQNSGGGQKVVESDKRMGVSQLLGARARAAFKIYAYQMSIVANLRRA